LVGGREVCEGGECLDLGTSDDTTYLGETIWVVVTVTFAEDAEEFFFRAAGVTDSVHVELTAAPQWEIEELLIPPRRAKNLQRPSLEKSMRQLFLRRRFQWEA
jgi:hypothetical protein